LAGCGSSSVLLRGAAPGWRRRPTA